MRVSIGTPEGDDEEARIAQEAAEALNEAMELFAPNRSELVESILGIPQLATGLVNDLFKFLTPKARSRMVDAYAVTLTGLLLDLFDLLQFPDFLGVELPPIDPLVYFGKVAGEHAAKREKEREISGYSLQARMHSMEAYIGHCADQLAILCSNYEGCLDELLSPESLIQRASIIRTGASKLLWQLLDDALDIAWKGASLDQCINRNNAWFERVVAGAPR